MPKYIVDFEFAGHVKISAQTEKAAKEKVAKMSIEGLSEHIQNFNVGKYYIEKI